MKRQLRIVLGMVLLLAGWFCAFLLNSTPDNRTLYIIVPTLLLGVGMGIILRVVGGKLTALCLALTALTSLATLNQIYPEKGIQFDLFQQYFIVKQSDGRHISLSYPSGSDEQTSQLEVFADISIELFALTAGKPDSLTFDRAGRAYVSIPLLGAIYHLSDSDNDGAADHSELFAVGLDRPSAVFWYKDRLYVAEPSQIVSFETGGETGLTEAVTIAEALPDDGGHWRRRLLIRDNLLYVSIGSRCNACEEENPERATVQRIDLKSLERSTYARGLRAVNALTVAPDGSLWCADNGRVVDEGQLFPDEINRLVADGDYGWPYCYGEQQVDSQWGDRQRCQTTLASSFTVPIEYRMQGAVFGSSLDAPELFRNSLYVSVSGRDDGHRVMRIPYVNGQLSKTAKEFIRETVNGDDRWFGVESIIVGPNGGLYAIDTLNNAIYRIRWSKSREN